MRAAIIYTRVSSADQVSGTSLASQEADCRDWCRRNGYAIARHFEDAGESARTADRPGLLAAMEFARREKPAAFVVSKLDRLSRDAADGLAIRAALRRHGTDLVSLSEPSGSDPVGQMVSTIMFAVAQFDNDLRGARAHRGMEETVRAGGWTTKPPAGYLSSRSVSGLPILIPDGERSLLLAGVLKAVAAGTLSPSGAARTLVEAGIPQQTASKILRNPVYGGILRNTLTGGGDVRAAFDGLVTPEEWYAVERACARSGPMRRRSKANEGFPLVGALLCATCQRPMIGAYSRSKTGARHGYYACRRGHVRLQAGIVHHAARAAIEACTPLVGALSGVVRKAAEGVLAGMRDAEGEASRLRGRLTRLDGQSRRIAEQWVRGEIDDDERRALNAAVRSERASIEERIESARGIEDAVALLDRLEHAFRSVGDVWDAMPAAARKELWLAVYGRVLVDASGSLSNPAQPIDAKTLAGMPQGSYSNGTPFGAIVELARRLTTILSARIA